MEPLTNDEINLLYALVDSKYDELGSEIIDERCRFRKKGIDIVGMKYTRNKLYDIIQKLNCMKK